MIWTAHDDIGKMDCFGMTDQGLVRRVNSDQFLIADLKRSLVVHRTSLSEEAMNSHFSNTQSQFLLVADGVGEELGREASMLAVDVISDYLLHSMNEAPLNDRGAQPGIFRHLEAAVQECRSRMQAQVAAHSATQHQEMGTTVTMAYIVWPKLYLTHAGDSRCYLLRNSRLQQLTTDHTFGQRLVNAGILEEERLASSHWNNVLWNFVGTQAAALQPEVCERELRIGDSILLCTDGLSKHVSEREITKILKEDLDAEPTCRKLIEAAIRSGGRDNVTVIVARFQTLERAQEQIAALAELPEPDPEPLLEPPATDEFVTEAAEPESGENPFDIPGTPSEKLL